VNDSEREIRNGIVEILCFLSSGKATESQMSEVEKMVLTAVEATRESCPKEEIGA
jgi:hypothetical protein